MQKQDIKEQLVSVWLLSSANDSEWHESFRSLLGESEQARLKKMSLKRQHHFILGRILLRKIVSEYFPSISSLQILEMDDLPPYLPQLESENIQFSISHSKNVIGVAITQAPANISCALGLDIEHMKPVRNMTSSEMFMDEQQTSALDNLGSMKEKAEYYYQLWTQKEAYFKAQKTGVINALTNEISIYPQESETNLISTRWEGEGDNEQEYQLSVFCDRLPFQVKVTTLNIINGKVETQRQDALASWEHFLVEGKNV